MLPGIECLILFQTSNSVPWPAVKSYAAVRTFQLLDFQLGWCVPLPKMARLIWLFLNLGSAIGGRFLN